jgi:hypothetical protein
MAIIWFAILIRWPALARAGPGRQRGPRHDAVGLTYGSSRLCRAAQFVAAGDQIAGHKPRLLAHADRAESIQPILADSALNRCLVLAKRGARLCLRGLLSGRVAGLRQQLIQHALGNQALGNPPAKTLLLIQRVALEP